MDSALEMMLEKYGPRNEEERENAIKEILQEIALAGLSRGGFFEKAAFYGGTCLRIFHGLPSGEISACPEEGIPLLWDRYRCRSEEERYRSAECLSESEYRHADDVFLSEGDRCLPDHG